MIGESIKRTKERLEKVKKQRNTQRRQRQKFSVFNISLVGYTNAGKSSLFNSLVKAKSYAADQLFATLDTTTRQIYLNQGADQGIQASLSDTVGFIRDLPHGLIDAFEATLQESTEADLLLHVVDASHPDFLEQMAQVAMVLEEIGASDIDQMLVFNKSDALPNEQMPFILSDNYEMNGKTMHRQFVSAKTGQGLDQLREFLTIAAKNHRQVTFPDTTITNHV
jgi:GTP-binding protein HflX